MLRLTLGLTGMAVLALTLGCRDSKSLYGDDSGTTPDATDDGAGSDSDGGDDTDTDDGTDGTDDGTGNDQGTGGDDTSSGELPTPSEGEALVYGTVLDSAGSPQSVTMQFCAIACLNGDSNADGSFSKLVPIDDDNYSYKIDAIGEVTEGSGWGRIRVHASLEEYEELGFEEALVLPDVSAASFFASESGEQTLPLGDVDFKVDPSTLSPAFGWDTWGYQAGVVEGGADYWEIGHELAVAFVPFDTEVGAPFSVSFPAPASATSATYDVYFVNIKGEGEGPIGAAEVVGNMIVIDDVQPEILSWLLLVPTE